MENIVCLYGSMYETRSCRSHWGHIVVEIWFIMELLGFGLKTTDGDLPLFPVKNINVLEHSSLFL